MNREQIIALNMKKRRAFDPDNREGVTRVEGDGLQYLFATNAHNQGLFLIWDEDGLGQLDIKTYMRVAEEAKQAGVSRRFIVYAKYEVLQTNWVQFHKLDVSRM